MKILTSGEIGPFSIILDGLPRPEHMTEGSLATLRTSIEEALYSHEYFYPKEPIGMVATFLATGHNRYSSTSELQIESVPEHGVTFHDPEAVMGYAGASNFRCALRDLVLASTHSWVESEWWR